MIDNIITIQKLMRSAKLFNVDNCFSVVSTSVSSRYLFKKYCYLSVTVVL